MSSVYSSNPIVYEVEKAVNLQCLMEVFIQCVIIKLSETELDDYWLVTFNLTNSLDYLSKLFKYLILLGT